MKYAIIIQLAIVLLIPISVFAQTPGMTITATAAEDSKTISVLGI